MTDTTDKAAFAADAANATAAAVRLTVIAEQAEEAAAAAVRTMQEAMAVAKFDQKIGTPAIAKAVKAAKAEAKDRVDEVRGIGYFTSAAGITGTALAGMANRLVAKTDEGVDPFVLNRAAVQAYNADTKAALAVPGKADSTEDALAAFKAIVAAKKAAKAEPEAEQEQEEAPEQAAKDDIVSLLQGASGPLAKAAKLIAEGAPVSADAKALAAALAEHVAAIMAASMLVAA